MATRDILCIFTIALNNMARDDESELISRLGATDRAAFEELLARYRQRVLNLAFRLLGDYHLSEDAAQEAFVNAYRAIGSLKSETQIWPWLRRIVLNVCLRIRERRQRASTLVIELEDIIAAPDACNTERLAIHAALLKLDKPLRMVIVLREFEELSYQEIATYLGIPIGTVRSRLAKARSELKELLSR